MEGRLSLFPPWRRHRTLIPAAVATVRAAPVRVLCSVSPSGRLCGGRRATRDPATPVQGHPVLVHLGPRRWSGPERGPPS